MQARLRTWLIGAALIALGALVGYALPQNTVSPKSEPGTVMLMHGHLGAPGARFEFKASGKGNAAVTYPLEDPTPWQATSGGAWHTQGQAPCLAPGAKATVGVINVHAVGSAPGHPTVVWIECYQ